MVCDMKYYGYSQSIAFIDIFEHHKYIIAFRRKRIVLLVERYKSYDGDHKNYKNIIDEDNENIKLRWYGL